MWQLRQQCDRSRHFPLTEPERRPYQRRYAQERQRILTETRITKDTAPTAATTNSSSALRAAVRAAGEDGCSTPEHEQGATINAPAASPSHHVNQIGPNAVQAAWPVIASVVVPSVALMAC